MSLYCGLPFLEGEVVDEEDEALRAPPQEGHDGREVGQAALGHLDQAQPAPVYALPGVCGAVRGGGGARGVWAPRALLDEPGLVEQGLHAGGLPRPAVAVEEEVVGRVAGQELHRVAPQEGPLGGVADQVLGAHRVREGHRDEPPLRPGPAEGAVAGEGAAAVAGVVAGQVRGQGPPVRGQGQAAGEAQHPVLLVFDGALDVVYIARRGVPPGGRLGQAGGGGDGAREEGAGPGQGLQGAQV